MAGIPPATAASIRAEDQDKLSDIIPNSADLSRQPSTRPVSEGDDEIPEVIGDDEGEEELDEPEDEDVDMESASTSPPEAGPSKPKTPSALAREVQKMERKTHRAAEQAKRKVNEGKLSARRREVSGQKLADSIKRFSYLLGQTDLFRHFCDLKKQREPEFAKLLEESENANKEKEGRKAGRARGGKDTRRRKTEKEEDEELLHDADGVPEVSDGTTRDDEPFVFTESPIYVKGGKMRDYQLQGLNWMVSLHHNGINGILADEMGLGKTLQTISFLGYLKFYLDLPGPHLVVVPKSTLQNWAREFAHWVPDFNIVGLTGSKEERAGIIKDKIIPQDFEVCITSYEMIIREKSALKKLSWEYIIIDEAHRIKNADSVLSQIVREFDSRARLLITGTPLQNNLHELWALLNFLLPDVFGNSEDFDEWFKSRAGGSAPDDEARDGVVQQLHKVLRPFLLRRVKADVEKSLLPKKEINLYVGMTEMQRKWYKMILEKNIDAVNGVGGAKEGKTRLLNIVMQLRKCCNHPYLFDGAEPGPPFTTDVHLVDNAGKLVILDKLLNSMKAKGSRVLIFSQMSRVLDILEDYCHFREYSYCRIDGSTAHEDRIAAIDDYNKPGSEKFIFLLTTRAGGLGINLTTADVVVLFDSDWNPQADLQAMDRAHRIGQTKQVYVFRFVTENSVEEKVLERAAQKLRLDQLVIQQGRASQNQKAASKDDLVGMIQHGAERIINEKESMLVTDDIDHIIKRGEERTAQLNGKYAELNFDDLANFKSDTTTTNWEGEEYAGKGKKPLLWIEPSKRERKSNYSVDSYYREAMRVGEKKAAGPKAPKAPKEVKTADHQFFPRRFIELQEQEANYFKKTQNYVVPLKQDEAMTPEELEEERRQEQEKITNAEPLTESEQAEKEELSSLGFESWTKRDYQAFIRGCEAYGKDDIAGITREVATKTQEEVAEYSEVFWDRYDEIEDFEKQIAKIEAAEAKRSKNAQVSQLLHEKVTSHRYPLQTLKILYLNQTKGKSYTEEEDRFILVQLEKFGMNRENVHELIKREISDFPAFRFNWFLKSRTAIELGRRCQTLLGLLVKEAEEEEERTGGAKKKKASAPKGAATNGDSAVNGVKKALGKKRAADTESNTSRASTPAGGPPKKKARKSAP